jgi:hypothetical protein
MAGTVRYRKAMTGAAEKPQALTQRHKAMAGLPHKHFHMAIHLFGNRP